MYNPNAIFIPTSKLKKRIISMSELSDNEFRAIKNRIREFESIVFKKKKY